jgi:hypothetical protein
MAPLSHLMFFTLVWLLFAVCWSKQRSAFTAVELIVVIVLHGFALVCGGHDVTFLSYYTSRFMASALFCFYQRWRERFHPPKPRLVYILGFQRHPFHAAMMVVDPENITARQQTLAGHFHTPFFEGSNAWEFVNKADYHHPVSVVHGAGVETVELEQILELSDQCHNWAQITIYELSADKFFSFAMLLFLRAEVWVLELFSIVCSIGDVAPLVDLLFIVIVTWDTWNVRVEHLQTNKDRCAKNHQSSQRHDQVQPAAVNGSSAYACTKCESFTRVGCMCKPEEIMPVLQPPSFRSVWIEDCCKFIVTCIILLLYYMYLELQAVGQFQLLLALGIVTCLLMQYIYPQQGRVRKIWGLVLNCIKSILHMMLLLRHRKMQDRNVWHHSNCNRGG